MIYYRIAYQIEEAQVWRWRSTSVTSLNAVLNLLRSYSMIPQAQLRVFPGSSKERMDEMLQRLNQGLLTHSISAEQIIEGKEIDSLDVARMEIELGEAGDHDAPYVYAMPLNVDEMSKWIKLMKNVCEGERIS